MAPPADTTLSETPLQRGRVSTRAQPRRTVEPMEQVSWHEGGGRSEMGGPGPPPEGSSLPAVVEVDSHGWIRTWSSASHPASSRKAPQVPEDHRRRRSARGGSGGLFLSRVTSGTEDFLTEGDVQNTRRRPQRAGPCRKAAPGDPPRSRPKSSPHPAPSFLRLPGCVGVTLCAFPPRLGRPVAWREVSPKGPNRRFDRRSYRLQRRAGGGGGGARDRADAESFPFRNPAPTLRNPEVTRGYRGCRLRKPGSNRLAPFLLL